ncbi:MAG: TetR/AcrR family transcriptional regulator [Microbacterium sp.]
MTTVLTRTERAALTRESIIDSALVLFTTRGFRAVSLREIAAAAGISHPSLLKHFGDKAAVLDAVLGRFHEQTNPATLHVDPTILPFPAVAEYNATVPGYLPLFATLTGEASAASHPAHDVFRRRCAHVRSAATEFLASAASPRLVAADRDPQAEALRLVATWDSLQVVQQYLPERVDVAQTLRRHDAMLARPVGWRDGHPATDHARRPFAVPRIDDAEEVGGYRSGRERRAKIVRDAMTLFAREGYGDTTLRDIAERVGVSKSALYHHFSSKEQLLLAVLSERDRLIEHPLIAQPPGCAADLLRGLADGAERNTADQPGLVEVYAALTGEAVPAEHPAHGYFAHRYGLALDTFTRMFVQAADDGDLPPHRDPAHEALWLLALWDGLQYQWLYDRGAVDVASHLRAHLADVLPGMS